MALRRKIFVKTPADEKNQQVQIRCGHLLNRQKKACPQCCSPGGQSFLKEKSDLRFLKPDFKGVFKCCEQFEGVRSNPDHTPSSIDFVCVVRIGSDEDVS